MKQDAAKIPGQLRRGKKKLRRREIIRWMLGRLGQQLQRAMSQVVEVVLDCQVEELLGRRRWEAERLGQPEGEGQAVCHRCGASRAEDLWRNGHFRRTVMTCEGAAEVKVPPLRGKRCRASGQWDKGLWVGFDRLVQDWDELVASWLQHGSVRPFAGRC